jgi:polysaccharide export outer membrane protein
MRLLTILTFSAAACFAQTKFAPEGSASNLPVHTIGPNDLLSVSVYDSPELSKLVRVSSDGHIKLPMLKRGIKVQGHLPVEVEALIAKALTNEEILVDPLVTVTVAEYQSRPINVVGAVKNPLTFQAIGNASLLDAIGKAGGMTENAGSEILVTRPAVEGATKSSMQRIRVKDLIDAADPSLNIALYGGEEIRVPAAGRVFVIGNVKRPGAFVLRDGEEGTVMEMLALAEGLAPYPAKQAFIYRRGQNGSRTEVPVELESILKRKHADVVVLPDDIVYIPDNKNRRLTMAALERVVMFGSTAGATALIYSGR